MVVQSSDALGPKSTKGWNAPFAARTRNAYENAPLGAPETVALQLTTDPSGAGEGMEGARETDIAVARLIAATALIRRRFPQADAALWREV